DELNSQLENKNSKVKVLVKYYLPNETKLENLDTWLPDDKVKATDEFSVSGVTLVGFDSIDSESQRLISSLKHEISNDVIFLRAGDKPNPLTFGFIILGISLIGTILPPFASYKIYIWNKYGRPSESDPTPLNLNSK
ncbi:MAG TPA: hypothetical protein PKY82_35890, partial [Pyrinomonadaceae bacterium]|nr:hypothetical protein [Pyrinomonadaceae bacterium]